MDGVAYRQQSMACPSCGQALVEEKVFDRPIRRCQQCLGEWADEATLLAFFNRAALARRPPTGQSPAGPPPSPARLSFFTIAPIYGQPQRRCPACAGPMKQAGLARLVVDRCERDGVWFERGNLAIALSRPTDVVWPPPPVDAIALSRPSWSTGEVIALAGGILLVILMVALNFAR